MKVLPETVSQTLRSKLEGADLAASFVPNSPFLPMISTDKLNACCWNVSLTEVSRRVRIVFQKNIKDAPRLDTLRHTFLQYKKNHIVTKERGTRSLFEVQGQTPNSAEVGVNEVTAFRIVSVHNMAR